MKIFIRTILSLLTILVIILFVITCVFIYNKQSGKLTYFFGYTGFINTGTSMLPNIKPGDLIIVKKMPTYEVDDIVSFASEENYITTHRIIDKNRTYTTKGDNNNFVDSQNVADRHIYGKLIWIIPNVSKFLNFVWLHKYVIIGITLIIPGIILVFIKRGHHVR